MIAPHLFSRSCKNAIRPLFIALLGLLGLALVTEGLWFVLQGTPFSATFMLLGAGGILVGCAWWLLFRLPIPEPDPVHIAIPKREPKRARRPPRQFLPEPIWIPIRYSRIRDEAPLQTRSPEAIHAAFHGIGLKLLQGATWENALDDPQWVRLMVFLHCERDKLGESSDDVDGLYFTREEAEAAAAVSPQADNGYVWKIFVSAMGLGNLAGDRKALPHLARTIKAELATLPPTSLPGTAVTLGSLFGGKAYLDASGRRIVLFEDEGLALDSLMLDPERQTGVFRSAQGAGIFDESGLVLIPPHFEDIKVFDWDLAAARFGGLWGFLNRNGEWHIPPQFLEVDRFFGVNKARARSDKGWGAINRRGQWIIPPAWESLEFGLYGSFRVTRGSLCGYIDAAGRCLAPFQREPYWLDDSTTFDPPPAAFVLCDPETWRRSYAMADAQARRLTGFDFAYLGSPSEGLLVARVDYDECGWSYGYLDISGEWVIPARFAHACDFSEGLAQAGHHWDRFGYINRQGKMVIPEHFRHTRPFQEGLAAVSTGLPLSDYRYGYIDRTGTWTIQPRFEDATVFSQGLAAARADGLWGLIDRNGHWVIAPAFTWVGPFSDGHTKVTLQVDGEEQFGIIDREGQWLVPPQYPAIGDVRRIGLARAAIATEPKWIAAVHNDQGFWGGVKLGRGSDPMGEVVVAFECFSEYEVFRVMDKNEQ